MGSKQAKRARAEAYSLAKDRNLWNECVALLAPWQRVLRKLFPRAFNNRVAQLYSYNLATWAHNLFAVRPGTKAFEAAMRERSQLAHAQRKSQAKRNLTLASKLGSNPALAAKASEIQSLLKKEQPNAQS